MELTIGYVSDDEKTVSKNYNAVYVYEVKVKDNDNIVNPTFLLTTTDTLTVNYCYCEKWNRYYYIDSIDVLTGGRVALNCRVDVLMSFKDDIYNLSAIIDKQQDIRKANMYLDDGSLVAENRTNIEIKDFSNGFSNNGNYIIVVAGG